MITYTILAGSVDVSVVIRIIDSTDGTPETGVVFNTSGIDIQYRRELATSTAITEATLAALTTAHADGGFLHIGNGYYRLDLPDAAVGTGVSGVLVHGIVTGMVVIGAYINLTPVPVDVRQYGGSAGTFTGGRPEVNTTHWGGTAVASAVILAAANIATDAITAAKIAANAIADTKIATGAFTAAKFASGAFDAVWSVTARLLTAGTNIVLAKGTGVTGFNDLSAAQVNTEADTALSDYDGPTNAELVVALASGVKIGAVVDNVVNTAALFDTDLSETDNDHWVDSWLVFTSGTLVGQVKRITAYNGTTKVVTVAGSGFTAEPTDGDDFQIVNGR